MTSKKFSIILVPALLLSLSLKAQFRYSALLDSVEKTGFYSIVITPELSSYLKTDLSDLRIVDEKKQGVSFILDMPYNMRTSHPVLSDQRIESKITEDSKTILITENPGKQGLSNLILELKNAAAERTGSLSGSDNGEDWYVILDSLMLRKADEYSDTSHHQRINFPASTYRYFKLTVYNYKKEPLNILNASSSTVISSIDTIPRFLKNPQPKFSQTDSGSYSLVKIMFERPFQTGMIQLSVSRPWFYKRQAKIFTEIKNSLPATWFGGSHHTMTISSDDFSGNFFQTLKADILYLLIENGDNPPLQISSILTGSPNRSIIAHLEKGKSYTLLLDDPTAIAPVYDLEHFKDRIPAHSTLAVKKITATILPETVNTQALGNRWIWPVIILVIISLSILTWKLTTDMKKSNAQ